MCLNYRVVIFYYLNIEYELGVWGKFINELNVVFMLVVILDVFVMGILYFFLIGLVLIRVEFRIDDNV